MVLAVDVGNSNVVAGLFEGDRLLYVGRIATDKRATQMEYALRLRRTLALSGFKSGAVEGGILASVVPGATEAVSGAMELLTGRAPILVAPGIRTGLAVRTDNPAAVGSDRIADAVAAKAAYPPPLVVIDLGTANTLSVLDVDGAFLGGSILPGLRLSMEALTGRTAQLPRVSFEPPVHAIGRNTADCMRSGLIYGCAAAIDGLIGRIEAQLGRSCAAVATGGLAPTVIPHCRRTIPIEPDLLLRGLLLLYRQNAGV